MVSNSMMTYKTAIDLATRLLRGSCCVRPLHRVIRLHRPEALPTLPHPREILCFPNQSVTARVCLAQRRGRGGFGWRVQMGSVCHNDAHSRLGAPAGLHPGLVHLSIFWR